MSKYTQLKSFVHRFLSAQTAFGQQRSKNEDYDEEEDDKRERFPSKDID
jgi:hypothetical protein